MATKRRPSENETARIFSLISTGERWQNSQGSLLPRHRSQPNGSQRTTVRKDCDFHNIQLITFSTVVSSFSLMCIQSFGDFGYTFQGDIFPYSCF